MLIGCRATDIQSGSPAIDLTMKFTLGERNRFAVVPPLLHAIGRWVRSGATLAFLMIAALPSFQLHGQTMQQGSPSGVTIDAPAPRDGVSTSDRPYGPQNTVPNESRSNTYVFPSAQVRARAFLHDLFSPATLIAPIVSAGIDQVRPLKVGYPPDGFIGPGEHPAHGYVPEWGEGFSGYSERFASRLGMNLIGTTGRYAVGEMLHEDTSYHPCACTGVLPRTYHAISQTLIAHCQWASRAFPPNSCLRLRRC